MSLLTPGADSQSTGAAQIDSIVPGADLTAVAINLVAVTHRARNYDPTAGDITLTLPTPVDGVKFAAKRVTNGTNVVKFTGQTIDGIAGDLVLGLVGEYVELVGNASRNTYDIIGILNPAVAQLKRDADSTAFGLTESFVQYSDWEAVQFSTPQRIIADLAGNEIGLENIRVPLTGEQGFRADIDITFEYTNNTTVQMQLVHSVDGVVSGPVAVNCDGTGKPVSLGIHRAFGITAVGDLWIEFISETAGGTFNVLNANFLIESF